MQIAQNLPLSFQCAQRELHLKIGILDIATYTNENIHNNLIL